MLIQDKVTEKDFCLVNCYILQGIAQKELSD